MAKNRSIFVEIHLYLGLIAGVIISIVCFTGSLLVFEDEITRAWHPDRYVVEVPSQGQAMALADLEKALTGQVDSAFISSVKLYEDPARSWELRLKDKGSATYFINPYTGEVLDRFVYRETFYYQVFALHRWLLSGDTGKLIVGTSTILFLFILLTGIIEWWPKTKQLLRQRLRINWKANWKRLNHDLHLVVGFYCAVFLFIFAFTGLAWSFKWFHNGIYYVMGSDPTQRPDPVKVIDPGEGAAIQMADQVLADAKLKIGAFDYLNLQFPKTSEDPFQVRTLPVGAPHESASDRYYFDPASVELLGTQLFSERSRGSKARSTFYPVHVGSIAGLPGRILAFLVTLIGSTFTITGVIMYINRLLKKGKKKRAQSIKQERKKEAMAYGSRS